MFSRAVNSVPGVINANFPNGYDNYPFLGLFYLNNDGTYAVSPFQAGDWITPTTQQLASLYEVKVDILSGFFAHGSSDDTGVYLSLSTTRVWFVEPGDSCIFNVSIRYSINGVVYGFRSNMTLQSNP